MRKALKASNLIKRYMPKEAAIAIIFFIMIVIALLSMREDSLYAKDLQIDGEIVSVEWKSSNHNLPRFTILERSGDEIVISHSTVLLNQSNTKVGDKLLKKSGDDYCWINDERVRFAR